MQPITRFMVAFETSINGTVVNFGGFNVTSPAETHIPLVGDEVLLPQEAADKAGVANQTFTVSKRRFIYNSELPAGVSGVAVLVLS